MAVAPGREEVWERRERLARRCRPARRPPPLAVELLEDRSVPALLTFASADPPLRLPPGDESAGMLAVTLDVADYAVIRDLNIHLDIRHGSIGEVQAVLFAPDGSRFQLFRNVGGDGQDFRATLDDEAATLIDAGQAPFNGSFQPLDSLHRLIGTDVHGEWLLELTDTGEQGFGFLDGWSLRVETATPTTLGTPVNGSVDAANPVEHFVFEVTTPGLVTIEAAPLPGSNLDPRVTLWNSASLLLFGVRDRLRIGTGGLQASSDDRVPGDVRPLLQQYLPAGTWYIDVSGVGGTSGGYRLSTSIVAGPSPYLPGVTLPSLLRVGDNPRDIVQGDFNRDGVIDVATANHDSGDVSVLLGGGDGSFLPQQRFLVGGQPDRLAIDDFNQDGRDDLLVLDSAAQTVRVLLGQGDGSFRLANEPLRSAGDPRFTGAFGAARLDATGDFNRDGDASDRVFLTPLAGDPSRFASYLEETVGISTQSDAFIDLRTGLPAFRDVVGGLLPDVVRPGPLVEGDHYPLPDSHIPLNPARATPLLANLHDDDPHGVLDAVVVSRSGALTYRRGRDDRPGTFNAPEILNDVLTHPVREAAILNGGAHARIAVLELFGDTLAIYSRMADAQGVVSWVRSAEYGTGLLPVRLAAGDLDGDRLPDLVVGNFLLGTLSLYRGKPDGTFQPLPQHKVGVTISDVVLADVNRDGRFDVVTTNHATGEVGVLLNRALPPGSVAFEQERRFRGGIDPDGYGSIESVSDVANAFVADELGISPAFPPQYFVISHQETAAVVVADFTSDTLPDLLVSNRGADNTALLPGKTGSFADPGLDRLFATGAGPASLAAGDFDRDGDTDVAVLNEADSTITVLLNDGHGGFTALPAAYGAGNSPTGLSAADLDGDDILDLAVGNVYGDLLLLQGNGNGTFKSFVRSGQKTAMAVGDLDGDGKADDVWMSSQSVDLVQTLLREPGTKEFAPGDYVQDRGTGVDNPGAVALRDLNGDGRLDRVTVNSGGNSLLIAVSRPDGSFDLQSVGTGTTPMAVTFGFLNGDDFLDAVVANQGSNDVSVLYGQGDGADWHFTLGPRLDIGAGQRGPMAVELINADEDGLPDLRVTNGQSGTVSVLPGRTGGTFLDTNPTITPIPGNPTIVARQAGVLITAAGDLLDGLSFRSLFQAGAGRGVASVASVVLPGTATPALVAARTDGSVSLLISGGGLLSEALTFRNDRLDRPSDVQVVFTDQGDPEFYVSDEGQGRVVVFELADGIPVVVEGRLPGTELAAGGATTLPIFPVVGAPSPSSGQDGSQLNNLSQALALLTEDRAGGEETEAPGESVDVVLAEGDAEATEGEASTLALVGGEEDAESSEERGPDGLARLLPLEQEALVEELLTREDRPVGDPGEQQERPADRLEEALSGDRVATRSSGEEGQPDGDRVQPAQGEAEERVVAAEAVTRPEPAAASASPWSWGRRTLAGLVSVAVCLGGIRHFLSCITPARKLLTSRDRESLSSYQGKMG